MANQSELRSDDIDAQLTSDQPEQRRAQTPRSPLSPIPSGDAVPAGGTLEAILATLVNLVSKQASQPSSEEAILQALRSARVSQSPFDNSGKEPKVNSPDVFSGERSKLTNFLMQVNLVFKLQPRRYTTDEAKIYYVIGYLRGPPETSIKSYLALPNDRTPDFLKYYDEFETYLKGTWGDPDERNTAATKIYEVRQTGSSAVYFAQIEQYAAILAWPDEVLIHIARAGLKSEIKDLMVGQTHIPTNWPGFIHSVNELDIRLYERQVEKQKESASRQPRNPSYPVSNDRTTSRNPAPHSRTDSRVPTNTFSKTVSTYRGPISVEERERRMRDNLCLRCGQAGHIAVNCQVSSPPRTTSTTSTTPATAPAPTSSEARSLLFTRGHSPRLNGAQDQDASTTTDRSSAVRSSIKVSAPP